MASQVQGTNDSSVASKVSMISQGYAVDPYILCFVSKPTRRSPLINMGYFVRYAIMESSLNHFADYLSTTFETSQIISLGAGFDSSFFKMALKLDKISYYEIDFKDVVENKIRAIKSNPELLRKLRPPLEMNPTLLKSGNYFILPHDLSSDLNDFEHKLRSLGVDFNQPTLLFSECAITYMDEAKSTALIKWAARKFVNGAFLTYEQINPNDGFGIVMKKHFEKLSTPLKSIDVHPTLQHQKQRYSSCGWTEANSVGVLDLFNKILSFEDRRLHFLIEPFDEWEEWHLKCCHYSLSVGYNGVLIPAARQYFGKLINVNIPQSSEVSFKKIVELEIDENCSIERYGMGLADWPDRSSVLLIGGFGSTSNSHSRIAQIALLSYSQPSSIIHGLGALENLALMYQTCSVVNCDQERIRLHSFGGRRSPLEASCDTHLVEVSFDNTNPNGIAAASKLPVSGDEPTPRWRHSAVHVLHSLWVFGGRTPNLKVLGDLWRLDFHNDPISWAKISSIVQPCPRFSHSSTLYEQSIVISGGLNNNIEPLSDIWMFNTEAKLWTQLQLLSPLLPRYGHTSHVIDKVLYLVGGVNTSHSQQPGVAKIDLVTGSCSEYQLPGSIGKLPVMLHNHSSFVHSSSIVIVGGGGNCFSFGTFFNKYIITIDTKQFI